VVTEVRSCAGWAISASVYLEVQGGLLSAGVPEPCAVL
jgi:hypothetical protein